MSFEEDLALSERLAGKVRDCGGTAYYVGGFVRDALRGTVNHDLDIEIHGIAPAVLENILDSLGERLSIGESFGIYGLKGHSLDIAMPRREECRGRGHKDFDVFVDPHIGPEKAARRRDFTINALMREVLTDRLVDPFGGKADLEHGILRHVDDQSFAEDPLRVLRGAQFAARFGFAVADETMELFRTMPLSHLPSERIMGELEKALLKAEKPSVFFRVLHDAGQLHDWFPELEALIGVEQPPNHHAEGDAYTHTLLVLDEAAKLRERASSPLGFMLAALTHDFGKAVSTTNKNGVIHAYGHETAGLPLIERFLNRLTSEKVLTQYVRNLAERHMKPGQLCAAASSVKATNALFDGAVDPEALIALSLADGRGKLPSDDMTENEAFLNGRLKVYREYMARPYVMGRDLVDAGLHPDVHFSAYLAYAHKLRLAGVDKESALKQTLAFARKDEGKKE